MTQPGLILQTTFGFELFNGNEGRTKAWYGSAKVRKDYEDWLRLHHCQRKPFDHPGSVVVTRILGAGQPKWDADSILRGSAKELIDALVAVGWFHDDGPKWIVSCDGRQDDTQRKNGPAVMIQVFDARDQ